MNKYLNGKEVLYTA